MCKVLSLSHGRLLRNIVFPSLIDAIVLDPAEHVFYVGSRDGNIYIAALSAESSSSGSYGKHILISLYDHSKAVTCLAYSIEGNLLLSGSQDGMVHIWDPRTFNIVRMFKHGKGPVNNILAVRQPNHLTLGAFSNSHVSSRRQGSLLPPPLEKYMNMDKDTYKMGVIRLPTTCNIPPDVPFNSSHILDEHVKLVEVFYFSPNVLDTLCYPRCDFCLCSHIVTYYAWLLSSIPNILLLISLLKINCIIFHRPEISIHLYVVVFSLPQQGSSAANEMEVGRLKLENRKAMHMVQQWKKMYGNLHEFCVTELLKGDGVGSTN